MRFHDLRHTFATALLRSGVDVHRVQRLMRHSDVRVTTVPHLSPGPRRSSTDSAWAKARRMRKRWGLSGAGNRIRTGDPQLGKLMLYQLSYSRPDDGG